MSKSTRDILEGEEVIVDEIDSKDIGKHEGGIEAISVKQANTELFMEERLDVLVHPPQQEGDLRIICPSCNGLNQPIIRGKIQKIKRKFVEILARTRTSRYEQVFHATERDKYRMIEHKALTYPFAVIKDPSGSKGALWLDNILAEK